MKLYYFKPLKRAEEIRFIFVDESHYVTVRLYHIADIYHHLLVSVFLTHTSPRFHSQSVDSNKERITALMVDPNSPLKVLICSFSLSVGMEISTFYDVIHYGLPSSITEYIL